MSVPRGNRASSNILLSSSLSLSLPFLLSHSFMSCCFYNDRRIARAKTRSRARYRGRINYSRSKYFCAAARKYPFLNFFRCCFSVFFPSFFHFSFFFFSPKLAAWRSDVITDVATTELDTFYDRAKTSFLSFSHPLILFRISLLEDRSVLDSISRSSSV